MDNVETATAPTTFSVLDFVQETAYPEGEFTIHTDIVSAKELLRLNFERRELETENMDEAEKLTPRIQELEEIIEKSALTFKVKGFPPGIVQQMMDEHNNDEDENAADAYLIAKAIISVKNANGDVDDHLWTGEEVRKLQANISNGEYLKLLAGVADVLFNATIFDRTVDAGFLGRRTDVAA